VAIVTAGGLVPGVNDVVHSIVLRHHQTYLMDRGYGRVFGIYNSFKGLCNLASSVVELSPSVTKEWVDQGGSKLGTVRYYQDRSKLADVITANLRAHKIDILYIIGGDRSLWVAHEIAARNPRCSIVGIPSTLDNNIFWVTKSLGLDTAVEQAAELIDTLKNEAEATRRIVLIKLFGEESGFMTVNTALASGYVDAVVIPELVRTLNVTQAEEYLNDLVDHIQTIVTNRLHNPHAVITVADGVETILEATGASIEGVKILRDTFVYQLTRLIGQRVRDATGQPIGIFVNEPRHLIRAVRANMNDRVYAERLGALAVDSALAGYTDCVISFWQNEFVLVPIPLTLLGQKSILLNGSLWKELENITGQPLSPSEYVA
jgi:6-phosphofructokinase 1